MPTRSSCSRQERCVYEMVLFTPTKVLRTKKCAEDTPLTMRKTLPYRECVTFIVNGYLHSATPLVCEVNQSASRRLIIADELYFLYRTGNAPARIFRLLLVGSIAILLLLATAPHTRICRNYRAKKLRFKNNAISDCQTRDYRNPTQFCQISTVL